MINKNFNLYYIKDSYIEYLRCFDSRVPYNKNKTRPYVGIVCIFKHKKYFIPMASPKDKHLKLNANRADIYLIENGKLGLLNINNMIPALNDVIEKINFDSLNYTYKKLLTEQINYINDNKNELLDKISKFFVLYDKNKLYENIRERTCDFYLLEKKCEEWKNKNSSIIKEDEEMYHINENDYRVKPY